MEQGPSEQVILRQCLRERLPLPRKIADAPELELGLELYYDAFWELNTCRSVGFGVGPIPWSAVNDYAQAFHFDEEQVEALGYFIRQMDEAYLKHQSRKSDKCPPGKGSAKGWVGGRKR